MNHLTTITEQDVFPEAPIISHQDFSRRLAARAVVFDEHGRVALLHAAKRGFHKLPGGGIEAGENFLAALERELLEEIGCRAEIVAELGDIVEHRDQWQQTQTSYCYVARQTGAQQPPAFTGEEQADGFEVVWVGSIAEAISLLEADRPIGYDGQRMRHRDLIVLKAAQANLSP